MAELGESADPRALIPGEPEAARGAARSMTAYAGNLHEAGAGLARVASPAGWAGESADRFRERFAVQPPTWTTAGDAFTEAGRALDVYAETLAWAQLRAAEAVRLWAEAAAAPDPGDAGRRAARDVLEQARSQLAMTGDDAAGALERLADAAPTIPGFWDDVGEVLGDLGDGALDVGRDLVNGAASVGNAALHHPADVAAMAGGIGLVLLGAGGELGGAALDLTGVGAPAGVSLNIASAGVIVSGVGIAGAGAFSVAQNAVGGDRVEPLQADPTPPTPTPRPAATRPAVADGDLGNIVRDLYRGVDNPGRVGDGTTADAIRVERATGGRVGGRLHTTKGNGAIRALRRWLRRNPGAAPTDRGIAQNELQNLLDALGRTS